MYMLHGCAIHDVISITPWRDSHVQNIYKGYVNKVFLTHVHACAVSQLSRHLLGKFWSL
jgi:hypothetical protein